MMPTPTSRSAYKQYYELLDRALDSKVGIQIEVNSLGEANQFRVRLNTARALDRELSCATYNPEDPQYGISAYEHLVISTKGDDDWGEITIRHSHFPTKIKEIAS